MESVGRSDVRVNCCLCSETQTTPSDLLNERKNDAAKHQEQHAAPPTAAHNKKIINSETHERNE